MAKPVTRYLGIDPGASGGLALLTVGSGWTTTYVLSMPATPQDLWEAMQGMVRDSSAPIFAVIEKVGGFIKGRSAPGSHMFNFGKGAGHLEMALIAAGIPHEEAQPTRWQKGLGIPSRTPHDKTRQVVVTKGKNKGKMREERYGGETDSQFKNRLKKKAQQLFPTITTGTITLDTADALLIAEYCRRLREGKL